LNIYPIFGVKAQLSSTSPERKLKAPSTNLSPLENPFPEVIDDKSFALANPNAKTSTTDKIIYFILFLFKFN